MARNFQSCAMREINNNGCCSYLVEMIAPTVVIWCVSVLLVAALGKSCISQECTTSPVVALIPARAGSKGIKDKNLARIGNSTLLSRAITSIKQCGRFRSVWVSTDGPKIAEEAQNHGANVYWRNPETATDNATTISAVKDFLNHNKDAEAVAVVQCTSPFIKPEFLCSALDLLEKKDVECVFSVTRIHHLKWIRSKGGYVEAVNFDPRNRPRRQDWEGELIENGMFYFARTRIVMEEGLLQNHRCKVIEIPKKFALDIDAPEDLVIARSMMKIINEH